MAAIFAVQLSIPGIFWKVWVVVSSDWDVAILEMCFDSACFLLGNWYFIDIYGSIFTLRQTTWGIKNENLLDGEYFQLKLDIP